jgi:membrane protease YdiL (CAAX protease family)
VLVGEAALRLVAFTLLALATLVVALWAQTSAMYLCLDPAPDRLAGLSVAGAFGVMSAALPSAVLLLAAALAPPAMTVGVLAVYALLAWCLERAAVDRLRWILDPAGDPHAAAHAWPALRALGVALLVQVLTGALLAWLGVPLPGVVVGAYVMFTAVLVPWAWRGRRAALAVEAVAPRWTHARAVLTGIVGGVLTCGAALAYLRWIAPGTEATSSLPVAGALREAGVLGRVALAAVVMLCAPVAEEMLFRGWLQPALGHDLPRRWRAWALVPAAAVFTLVHPLPAWGPVGLAGLLSGALLARSGRLSGSLALHVTHNSLVLAISLAGPWLVDAGR